MDKKNATLVSLNMSEQKDISDIFVSLIDLGIVDGPDSLASQLDWSTDQLLDFIVATENGVDYPIYSDQYHSLKSYISVTHVSTVLATPNNLATLSPSNSTIPPNRAALGN